LTVELEEFRSAWRKEIQRGREARAPTETWPEVNSTRAQEVPAPSSPRRSEEAVVPPHSDLRVEDDKRSPLEIYENAILKEHQGSLSEAVLGYRKAFKVSPTSLFPQRVVLADG